ncbi:sugar phosphate isomerase [Arthrobacter sp. MYb229]|uniref:EboA domain-containing protein n=1 Tax=unclassified Arthrobacter TaxID=235627 RepID=UPI000CFBD11F|nr:MULTISPECIES: EboA domain-containing protein [unclassified Arthrobacter]PRA01953.1 sugar phosphate isomerase [Arthrobacter sp. MYb229]PRB50462.1 sugar phosphate isomerase [Arthrobacter sp. MYb216]
MTARKALTDDQFRFALGYGTNGFADHPLPVALELLAEQGYTAVALTLGHPHLDPFADDLEERLDEVGALLARNGLRVVVETGTRFLLDARQKHRPALVDKHAGLRLEFLRRAVDIAAKLDAECVSFFSGILPEDATEQTGWQRLTTRVAELVEYAAARDVLLAIEPEPGMVVETVADALRLHGELGEPRALRLTVDIGHCVVVEPGGVDGALRLAGDLLANVQLDDMLPHTHEHLPFGDGVLDLPLALATLAELDYRGVAAVELPRHSWDAPGLAERSMAALRAAWTASAPARTAGAWLADSTTAVLADHASLPRIFATAPRSVGRAPRCPGTDPTGVLFGTVADDARARLIARLGRDLEPAVLTQLLRDLYHRGDSAERRGVLRGLGALAEASPRLDGTLVLTGLELTSDALRSNETSLVAAAVGPFAAAHLDQHAWRHAVLKLVFMGVSLAAATGLQVRADAELARMAADFAAERRAASRPIPEDLALLTRPANHPTSL